MKEAFCDLDKVRNCLATAQSVLAGESLTCPGASVLKEAQLSLQDKTFIGAMWKFPVATACFVLLLFFTGLSNAFSVDTASLRLAHPLFGKGVLYHFATQFVLWDLTRRLLLRLYEVVKDGSNLLSRFVWFCAGKCTARDFSAGLTSRGLSFLQEGNSTVADEDCMEILAEVDPLVARAVSAANEDAQDAEETSMPFVVKMQQKRGRLLCPCNFVGLQLYLT